MTPEQFVYWLQGFVELNGDVPNPEQWESIKNHLGTVFFKITPDTFKMPEQIPSYNPNPIFPEIIC